MAGRHNFDFPMRLLTKPLSKLLSPRLPSLMREPRFDLHHAPLEPAAWSAHTYDFDFEMDATCARAFDVVTGEDPEVSETWFPDFESLRWLDGAKPGVGSRREYRTSFLTLIEEVDVWEPGRRFGFWVRRASWPIHRRFRELYEIEPRGERARVRWTVAYEPHPRLVWVVPYGHAAFQKTFDAAAANLRALRLRQTSERVATGAVTDVA